MRKRSAATLAVLAASLGILGGVRSGAPAPAGADTTPAYRDASLPVDQRAQDLLSRMTLKEKVGQMGQINVTILQGDPNNDWDRGPLNDVQLQKVLGDNQIGSILSGGGAWPPTGDDGKAWADEINAIQKFALDHSRLGIPVIYGADAVHGHNNLFDATMVPHQIGLGATFDPALAERLGHGTARAVRATGVVWDFAPVLDTERDLRWGRSYEPFGEDPLLTGTLGAATIRGLQGRTLDSPTSVVATAKHFTGYSAPDSGFDRTDATIDQAELQDLHLPPFQHGIDAGVGTVMVNSGSVNGEPVHASHHLLTDVLRGQLHFRGVVISDWQDVENLKTKYHVAATMEDAIAMAVNAGLDISMIPLDAGSPDNGFVPNLLKAVADKKVTEDRIDQSVARILALKFRLGLFEHPYVDADRANAAVEDPADRPLARKAAQESLVLLGNDGALPLSRHDRKILVTGPASDSPTNQLGGWTLGWQGAFNLPPDIPLPEVTTIREGVQQAAGHGVQVIWKQGAPVADTTNRKPDGSVDPNLPEPVDPLNDPDNAMVAAQRQEAVAAAAGVDAIVVAVGESPYAEGQGDDATPELSLAQARLVDDLEGTGKPVIVVVVAGRPLVMNRQLDNAGASLMAFLPGSEGGAAIGDALFGKVNPSGRLPVSWPKASSQLPLAYNERGKPYDPRYPFGHGLSYTRFDVGKLRAPSRVRADDRFEATVKVANVGRRDGDDVVLAFVQRPDGGRQLVAFTRVSVHRGDRAKARLSFPVTRLAVTQASGERAVTPGSYTLVVGGLSQTFQVG
ncbi:MAG TPA: glycoside hydrolase family 3 N-terminal domain-containing protein [Solirubrobacteraceae bacterium]